MSAKQTATSLLNQLDDNANWEDVKNTIMGVYKRETGDAKADAIAAVILVSVFVAVSITWISSQQLAKQSVLLSKAGQMYIK